MVRGVAAGGRAGAGGRPTSIALGAALVLGLLAACSSATPSPTATLTSPPATVSTSAPPPSATPESPPVQPPEMQRSDEVGAVAAAEYFMALWAYSVASGDLSEWDALSATGCTFCSRVRDDVIRVYDAGGSYRGGQLEKVEATPGRRDPTLGGFPVSITFSIAGGAELDAAGSVVREIDPEVSTVVIDTVFSSQRWRLVELSVDAAHSVYSR